jgi:hypothetical protein
MLHAAAPPLMMPAFVPGWDEDFLQVPLPTLTSARSLA